MKGSEGKGEERSGRGGKGMSEGKEKGKGMKGKDTVLVMYSVISVTV